MIPLSSWIKSQANALAQTTYSNEVPDRSDGCLTLLHEVSGLINDLLDNVQTSQVAGLRFSMQSAQKHLSQQLTVNQDNRMSAELTCIETRVTDAMSQVLLPILADRKLREVMNEFCSTLKKLLPEFAAGEVTVFAPPSVSGVLGQSLNRHNVAARIVTSEDGNLTAMAGQVTISAGLQAWGEKLNEAMLE